ncbi:hypothetical protein ACQJBY_053846 [Aegilops geniculata]
MEEEHQGSATTQIHMADRGVPAENPEGRSATTLWTAQEESPREDPQYTVQDEGLHRLLLISDTLILVFLQMERKQITLTEDECLLMSQEELILNETFSFTALLQSDIIYKVKKTCYSVLYTKGTVHTREEF